MKQLKIVFLKTYLKQVKSWSFLIMILAPFLFIGFSAFMGGIAANNANSKPSIGIINNGPLSEAVGASKEYQEYKSEDEAKEALSTKKIRGYLTIKDMDGKITAFYSGQDHLSNSDKQKLGTILQGLQLRSNLSRAQLNSQQETQVLTSFEIKEEVSSKTGFDKELQQITLFMLIMLMYFLFIIYSTIVAQDLASEKGAKIMEMILSSISARNYFMGRMLGLLAVILTHMASYVLMFVFAYHFFVANGSLKSMKPLVDEALSKFSWTNLAYVVLGLFLYVIISAVCGSLVARQEDVNKAIQPVMFLVVFTLALAISQVSSADSIVAKVASFVPLTSPFLMPIRLIDGNVAVWENGLSLGILLLTIFVLVRFIGKRYAVLVLQNDQVSLWQVIKRTMQHQ